MSNINPIQPRGSSTSGNHKVEKEVKGLFSSAETQASAVASSQSQIEARIREFFIQQFGVARGRLLADRKSTRLNSSHIQKSRMPSSA